MRKVLKKIAFLLIFYIVIICPKDIKALTKTELKNLNLTRMQTYSLENGFKSVQGGTITDKYIVIAQIYDDSKETALVFINKDSLKKEKIVKKYKMNHANDMTYNSKTNQIIVTGGTGYPKLYIINAETFELEKMVITTRGYSSIAYDKENDNYVARRKQTAYILDLSFNEQYSFPMLSEDLTAQSFDVHKGKVYYTCYEAGRPTIYQKKYSGVLKAKENVVIVYDLEKQTKEKIYYIPQVTNEGVYPGEVEGIGFIENKMVIWTNKSGTINIFSPVIIEENKVLEVSIKEEQTTIEDQPEENKIEDKEILLELYDKDKLIDKAYNENGKFTFNNIYVKKEETIKYDIKLTSKEYKTNDKQLKITSVYDPFNNELVTNYDESITLLKKGPEDLEKEETKKETQKEEKTEEKKEKVKQEQKKETKKEKEPTNGLIEPIIKKVEEINKKVLEKEIDKKETKKPKKVTGIIKSNTKTIEEINKKLINKIVEEKEKEIKAKEEQEQKKIEEETKKKEDNQINVEEYKEIDVPDTNTKKELSIIGIILLALSLLIVIINKKIRV